MRERTVAPTVTAAANQAPTQPHRLGTWVAAAIAVEAAGRSRTPLPVFVTCANIAMCSLPGWLAASVADYEKALETSAKESRCDRSVL